jgi:hypothetical protein
MTVGFILKFISFVDIRGAYSSVSIWTGYGPDGPGIASRWGDEIFRTCPDRPWGPPSLLYNGYWVFSGGKERPGRDADASLPSSAVVMKSRVIPLLPLWAVRPVQSLSACTRGHLNFVGSHAFSWQGGQILDSFVRRVEYWMYRCHVCGWHNRQNIRLRMRRHIGYHVPKSSFIYFTFEVSSALRAYLHGPTQ